MNDPSGYQEMNVNVGMDVSRGNDAIPSNMYSNNLGQMQVGSGLPGYCLAPNNSYLGSIGSQQHMMNMPVMNNAVGVGLAPAPLHLPATMGYTVNEMLPPPSMLYSSPVPLTQAPSVSHTSYSSPLYDSPLAVGGGTVISGGGDILKPLYNNHSYQQEYGIVSASANAMLQSSNGFGSADGQTPIYSSSQFSNPPLSQSNCTSYGDSTSNNYCSLPNSSTFRLNSNEEYLEHTRVGSGLLDNLVEEAVGTSLPSHHTPEPQLCSSGLADSETVEGRSSIERPSVVVELADQGNKSLNPLPNEVPASEPVVESGENRDDQQNTAMDQVVDSCNESANVIQSNGYVAVLPQDKEMDKIDDPSIIDDAPVQDSQAADTMETEPIEDAPPQENKSVDETAIEAADTSTEQDTTTQDSSDFAEAEGAGSVDGVTEDKREPNTSVESEKSSKEESGNETTESASFQPGSPMITMLDDDLAEETKEEEKVDLLTDKVGTEQASSAVEEDCRRITRTRTGTLPVKTTVEYESDTDSIPDEEWDYQEGAESAPCAADPRIFVPEHVLKVEPEEMEFYNEMFANGVEAVLKMKIHCTICNRHIGGAPNYIHLGNRHKVLRVLICNRCRAFYGTGVMMRDSDGSELYCRWCGQGGDIVCCSHCPNVFCQACLKRNFGAIQLKTITGSNDWSCLVCNYRDLWHYRAICWALLKYTMQKKRAAFDSSDLRKMKDLEEDKSKCCSSKNHRKRSMRNTSRKSLQQNQKGNAGTAPANYEGPFAAGHFLWSENDDSTTLQPDEGGAEEDQEFDPSLFVQPVLEEPAPAVRPSPRPGRFQQIAPAPAQPVSRSNQSILRKIPTSTVPKHILQVRSTVPQIRPTFVSPPRIVVRQGGLMRPGLAPINRQPNSISSPPVNQRIIGRNTGSNLNHLDGVRSMEQLQSLDTAPWFRDGIDNMRAVGFAINKRIRELEARFHSLKNKQDLEKVMLLGKKLDRLSKKAESRFRQVSAEIKNGCRRWQAQRLTIPLRTDTRHQPLDPFSVLNEPPSDWDDDSQLSRPLEKVMIPINTSALHGGAPRIIRTLPSNPVPPPLVRTNTTVTTTVRNPAVPPSTTLVRMSSGKWRAQQKPQLQQLQQRQQQNLQQMQQRQQLLQRQPQQFQQRQLQQFQQRQPQQLLHRQQSQLQQLRQQLPSSISVSGLRLSSLGEKKGNDIPLYLNNCNLIDSVGNSVSITLSSDQKRKRSDSDSDIEEIYPTVSELISRYQIRPCWVHLERCDDFIASVIAEQEKKRAWLLKTLSERDSYLHSAEDDDDDDVQVIVLNSARGKPSRTVKRVGVKTTQSPVMSNLPADSNISLSEQDASAEGNQLIVSEIFTTKFDSEQDPVSGEVDSVNANEPDSSAETLTQKDENKPVISCDPPESTSKESPEVGNPLSACETGLSSEAVEPPSTNESGISSKAVSEPAFSSETLHAPESTLAVPPEDGLPAPLHCEIVAPPSTNESDVKAEAVSELQLSAVSQEMSNPPESTSAVSPKAEVADPLQASEFSLPSETDEPASTNDPDFSSEAVCEPAVSPEMLNSPESTSVLSPNAEVVDPLDAVEFGLSSETVKPTTTNESYFSAGEVTEPVISPEILKTFEINTIKSPEMVNPLEERETFKTAGEPDASLETADTADLVKPVISSGMPHSPDISERIDTQGVSESEADLPFVISDPQISSEADNPAGFHEQELGDSSEVLDNVDPLAAVEESNISETVKPQTLDDLNPLEEGEPFMETVTPMEVEESVTSSETVNPWGINELQPPTETINPLEPVQSEPDSSVYGSTEFTG